MSKPCKTYVDVLAKFDADGTVTPLRIRWEDGRVYGIARVTDVSRVASIRGGGLGLRYTIWVGGKQTYLWRDDDRWFVERK